MDADYSTNEALKQLQSAATPYGILASTTDEDNYRRVWARDAVISGLGGLLYGDELTTESLRASLEILAQTQGEEGQIASNVLVSNAGDVEHVSYGGLAGRVDPIPWYIIGVTNYVEKRGDHDFLSKHQKCVESALKLLKCWEFNGRGLIYMPQGGDWADEFLYHGYALNVQLLRFWALHSYGKLTDNPEYQEQAETLRKIIVGNYWLTTQSSPTNLYHPKATKLYLDESGPTEYLLPCFTPGGYDSEFDFLSNAIAALVGVLDREQVSSVLQFGNGIIAELGCKIAPAFWPPVESSDPRWPLLESSYLTRFKNRPYQYHNGGVWPMITGWWGAALVEFGEASKARELQQEMKSFNSCGEISYPEFGDAMSGERLGTTPCTWSAAAELFIESYLSGERLFVG